MCRNVLDSKLFQKETGSVLIVERNMKWKLIRINMCVKIDKILDTLYGAIRPNDIIMSIHELSRGEGTEYIKEDPIYQLDCVDCLVNQKTVYLQGTLYLLKEYI